MDSIPGQIIIEGTIVERSVLPDPKQSDYPDCRYTVHFKGHANFSGDICQRNLNLVVEGFKDYKKLPTQAINVGDLVRCTIVPFDNLPDELKSTQQADDLNLFQLDSYYVISIQKINNFSMSESLFSDGLQSYVSVFERHINPPIPDNLVKLQQKQIAEDLKKVNALLEGYPENITELNRKFKEQWEKEKAKDPPGYNRADDGKIVWRNVDNSFWLLPIDYTFVQKYPELSKQHLDALLGLKKFFELNGVQFIVSIVPFYYDIAARVMNPEFRNVPDYQTALLVRQLLSAGIETIYASDEIIKKFNRYEWAYFFHGDDHPSDTTQSVLAECIASRLERYHFPKQYNSDLFAIKKYKHFFNWDQRFLFPQKCDIGDNTAGKSYDCHQVFYENSLLKSDLQSPILVIGNSFIQLPVGKFDTPDSLASLISVKLLCGVDSFRIAKYGPVQNMIRLFLNNSQRIYGKKVVILQMGIQHFTKEIHWNDIAVLDKQMRQLVGKKVVYEFYPNNEAIILDKRKDWYAEYWNMFAKGKSFQIGDRSVMVKKIDCSGYDKEKKIFCIIPQLMFESHLQYLNVNGNKQGVVSCNDSSQFQQMMFELPAGTDFIEVKLEGEKGTHVAIQKIMLYQ